jgi:hypothetical protein
LPKQVTESPYEVCQLGLIDHSVLVRVKHDKQSKFSFASLSTTEHGAGRPATSIRKQLLNRASLVNELNVKPVDDFRQGSSWDVLRWHFQSPAHRRHHALRSRSRGSLVDE